MTGRRVLLLFAFAGAGAAGYLLGHTTSPERPATTRRSDLRYEAPAFPESAPVPRPLAEAAAELPPPPEEEADPSRPPTSVRDFVGAIGKAGDSLRSQQMLVALVGEAALRGGEMLPELREMLMEGTEIQFPSYDQSAPGYPSLRAALLDAVAATGDPAAADLLREVAMTTQSPVEIAFSAHLLERMDGLDVPTARRLLDSLSAPLTDQQRKVAEAVIRKVVPAAARVDPAYAEQVLATQLSDPKADYRSVVIALDGIEAERARDFTLMAATNNDYSEKARIALASRAAARPEIEILSGLRQSIEARTFPPKAAAQVARSSLNGGAFGSIERDIRVALKNNDFQAATRHVNAYDARLTEARRTLAAARMAGAQVEGEYDKQAAVYQSRLEQTRKRIAGAIAAAQQPPKKN